MFSIFFLLCCLTLLLLSSLRLAIRLFPASLTHLLAFALLLFTASLSIAASYAGVINQLHPLGLTIAAVLMTGGLLALSRYVHPFETVELSIPHVSIPRVLFLALLVVGFVILNTDFILGNMLTLSSDSRWAYFPNIINVVQAQTLHHFNGITMFFPMSYEILFAWELAFTHSYETTTVLHSLLYVGILLYIPLIFGILLKNVHPKLRMLITSLTVIWFILTPFSFQLLLETSKNDIYLAFCGIAVVYYFLRYWENDTPRDERYLMLIGLLCGLILTTKLSAIPWIALLALMHFVMLVRREPSWRKLFIRQGAFAALPCLIVALPWAVRVLLQPDSLTSQQNIAEISSGFTIWRLLFTPPLVSATGDWLWAFLLITIANVLLVWLPKRLYVLKLVAVGVLLVSLWRLTLWFDFNRLYFSSFYAVLATGSTIIVAWVLNRRAIPSALMLCAVFATFEMILLGFVPFSAWVDYFWDGTLFAFVNYRYAPTAFLLWLLLEATLIGHSLGTVSDPVASTPPIRQPIKPIYLMIVVVLLLDAIFVVRLIQPNYTRLFDDYLSYSRQNVDETPFFYWFNEHIHHSSIYAINVAPLMLYGEGMTNEVFYTTPQRSGIFGDQAYNLDELDPFLQSHHIRYIVLGFQDSLAVHARLRATDDVLAAVQLMRERFTVIQEGEEIIMFETPYGDDIRE